MALLESIAFNTLTTRFTNRYSFSAQVMQECGENLFSFHSGEIYKHGEGAFNTYYDTAYPSSVTYTANQEPSNTKVWLGAGVEGNTIPDLVEFSNDWPYSQFTDLFASDFRVKEGVFYAGLFRDKTSPNIATGASPLLTGDKMRSQALKVYVKYTATNKHIRLKHINMMYNDSSGHSV